MSRNKFGCDGDFFPQIDWKFFVKCETLDYDDAGVTSDTFCACLRMSSAAEQTEIRESERRQRFVNKVVIKQASRAVER